MLGQTISHYRIIEKLGQGGMGEVYLAEDTRLGHKVAIKRLSEQLVGDLRYRARFEREARAVAHLQHPNVLTLHEYDEIDGDLYVITEYASGGSLAQLRKESPDGLSVDRVLDYGIQIAEGLTAAHEQGIHHRDIKPDNLLLTQADEIRIADFGLARRETDTQITQSGAVLGTLAFMSPEQLAGHEADARSDIFSLGATLCELLGTRPDGSRGMAYAASETSVAALRTQLGDLPAGLLELLASMLEKDPSNRTCTAAEVGIRLRELRGVLSSADTALVRSRPTTNPPGIRWAVLAVIAAALAAWAATWLVPSGQDDGVQTVVILPLRDVTPDDPQPVLAMGFTESVIGALGRIGSVSVISRRSAEMASQSGLSTGDIREQLGADAIFDGSIMRIDDRIHIRGALVDAESDRNIWTMEFERPTSDIINLQREVSLAIANGIQAEIDPAEMAQTERTVDPEAFEEYLRARMLWEQRDTEQLREAVAIFRRLVAEHPDFAEAWVGLANALVVLPSYADVTPRDTYPEARKAAIRAIEIDPDMGEAWNVLAEIAYVYDFDYEESERLRLRSLQLNPSSATTHQWYAEFLTALGHHERALEETRVAQQLDPLSPLMQTAEAGVLIYARRYGDAIEHLSKVLAAHPDFRLAQHGLRNAYRLSGREKDAFEMRLTILRNRGFTEEELDQEELATFEASFEAGGLPAVERIHLERGLARFANGDFVKARSIAAAAAWTGDADLAIEWLERSYEARDIALLRLRVEAAFDPLRDDTRFQEIMRRINLLPEN